MLEFFKFFGVKLNTLISRGEDELLEFNVQSPVSYGGFLLFDQILFTFRLLKLEK